MKRGESEPRPDVRGNGHRGEKTLGPSADTEGAGPSAEPWKRLTRPLDLFIPEQELRSKRRSQARIAVGVALILTANWLISSITLAASDSSPVLVGATLGFGFALLAWLLAAQRLRLPFAFPIPLLVIVWASTSFVWFASGYRDYGALVNLAGFPILCVLIMGWRAGVAAIFISVSTIGFWRLVPVIEPLATGFWFWEDPATPAQLRLANTASVVFSALVILADRLRETALKEVERTKRQLQTATQMQTSAIELLRRLQLAGAADRPTAIEQAVEAAARIAGAQTGRLLVYSGTHDDPTHISSYTWSDEHPPCFFDLKIEDLAHDFRWLAEQLERGEAIALGSLGEFPPEAENARNVFASHGIMAAVWIPFRQGEDHRGLFAFHARAPTHWDPAAIRTLRMIGEVLTARVLEDLADQNRREGEARFALSFAAHPDGLILAALDNRQILECNDRILSYMGATRENIVGQSLSAFGNLLPPEDREQLAEAFDSSNELEMEFSLIRAGVSTPCSVTIAPVEISGRACILLMLRDLTHQRELEAQLAHAQKLDAIGSLAGGVAHDFNNMLGVIQGFTEKLQHELAGRGKAELEGIRKAVQRSADLVEQLLAFSRQRVLQPTLLDLNEVLTETDAMLGRLVGENIAIEVRTTQEIEAVEVDRSLAELAIVNLVVNARDAMSNGGRLEITAQRVVLDPAKAEELEVEAGNFIQLDIVDDGEGMDAKLQSQAMEPFFTTKGNGTGTGLGLTMVKRFARQSGGALTLTSHVGEGTRVSLLLPRVEGRVPVATQPASASRETAPRSGTILLVEDEEMLRRLAANALTEAGHHVIEAANGIEALERMDAFPDTIDILVTDAVMPKMGGGQLAERVRALRPQVRAIFTSGYTDQMMDLQPYDQFLAKPFLMSLLCQRVGEILTEPKPVDRSSAG